LPLLLIAVSSILGLEVNKAFDEGDAAASRVEEKA
jgi:hypothetical protein